MVHRWCMTRTNIDLGDQACAHAVHRSGWHSKREAVKFALRELAAQLTAEGARELMGYRWEGDLDGGARPGRGWPNRQRPARLCPVPKMGACRSDLAGRRPSLCVSHPGTTTGCG